MNKIVHKLFRCSTFWNLKPAFTCPVCGRGFRCFWDGHDIGGLTNVCSKCSKEISLDEKKHKEFIRRLRKKND
nr:hypothetical protein 13 [bacterium]